MSGERKGEKAVASARSPVISGEGKKTGRLEERWEEGLSESRITGSLREFHGISIAVVIHFLDRSLFTRLLDYTDWERWAAAETCSGRGNRDLVKISIAVIIQSLDPTEAGQVIIAPKAGGQKISYRLRYSLG
ncbi:MAG: hypothetical protein OXN17_08005 [Candidatus Poribacteria bacterium]|nr:hypothetical protein [Candidatus Poribacteria bacterium]MDE0506984.1 hypothetical protein [Candidatus Poribacteria bacterium]